jgi:hypothetical protein
MGRPRIPTAIQETKGYYISNPSRAHPFEPDTDKPLGNPPARLSADVQTVWHEVAAELLPGVGKESDRTMFEVLIRLIYKMRVGTIRIMELTALVSLCGRFGMSPADRSRIAVGAEPSNALTRFLNTRASSLDTRSN